MTPHEDRRLFAAWSPNMATAMWAINKVGAAHLLRWFVPDRGGYWLVFKDDSWIKARWAEEFPDAETLGG